MRQNTYTQKFHGIAGSPLFNNDRIRFNSQINFYQYFTKLYITSKFDFPIHQQKRLKLITQCIMPPTSSSLASRTRCGTRAPPGYARPWRPSSCSASNLRYSGCSLRASTSTHGSQHIFFTMSRPSAFTTSLAGVNHLIELWLDICFSVSHV